MIAQRRRMFPDRAFLAVLFASAVLGLAACAGNGADTAASALSEESALSGTRQPAAPPAGPDITARYPAYRFLPPFLRPQGQQDR